MAASDAIVGFGATISSSVLDAGSYTQLAVESTKIPLPQVTVDDIEVTHMESPGAFKEYLAGLQDGGEITVSCNYTRAGYQAVSALNRTVRDYRITLSNGDYFDFPGYIKAPSGEADMATQVTFEFMIRVAGNVEFTAGA